MFFAIMKQDCEVDVEHIRKSLSISGMLNESWQTSIHLNKSIQQKNTIIDDNDIDSLFW